MEVIFLLLIAVLIIAAIAMISRSVYEDMQPTEHIRITAVWFIPPAEVEQALKDGWELTGRFEQAVVNGSIVIPVVKVEREMR